MNTRIARLIGAGAVLLLIAGCGNKEQTDTQKENLAVQDSTTTQAVTQEPVKPATEQATPAETKTTQAEAPKKQEKPAPPKEVKLTIPDSTMLYVALVDSVQTNVNQVGDHFKGKLDSAVTVDGKVALPAGSEVDLVITKLVKGGTLKTPPEIGFTIQRITTPAGTTYTVAASEYYEEGRSHTRREVGMIGGGAAAGAVVGAIAGKKKGALIGAAVGAAVGTGAAAATGRQNLVYGPGQTVPFTTTQSVTVSTPRK
jgi:hypothetical protein